MTHGCESSGRRLRIGATTRGVKADRRDVADGSEVSINLIPHTVENTALGGLKAGSRVNLEIDTVARYVERMLQAGVLVPHTATYSKDTAE